MKRNTTLYKKMITLVLSFAVIAGIWGGMGINAKADEIGKIYKDGKEIEPGDVINAGDTVSIEVPEDIVKIGIVCRELYMENGKWLTWEHGSEHDGVIQEYPNGARGEQFTFPVFTSEERATGKTYTKYKFEQSLRHQDANNVWFFYFYLVDDSTEIVPGGNTPGENTPGGNTPSGNTSGEELAENNPAKENSNVSSESTTSDTGNNVASHTCNFEWVITVDPATGGDGLEEYMCTGCGAVSQSHPIAASVAVIKDFYGNVKEAPENGNITYDSGKLYTISDYILKKMAERNDVSVTVKFEYQNKKYQLTFPAGLNYSAVLTDEETMYGYFGAAAKLGLKVAEQ